MNHVGPVYFDSALFNYFKTKKMVFSGMIFCFVVKLCLFINKLPFYLREYIVKLAVKCRCKNIRKKKRGKNPKKINFV